MQFCRTPLYTYVIFVFLAFSLTSCRDSPHQRERLEQSKESDLASIEVNGQTLHYLDQGSGDVIVFIHGTISDYRVWEGQIDTFSQDHRVVAYSRRYAHPNKQVFELEQDFTPQVHAEDLVALIDALDLGRVHLIGHSYGAFTALMTAMQFPTKVKSLVLGEPPVLSLLNRTTEGRRSYDDLLDSALRPAAAAFKREANEAAVSLFVGGVSGDSLAYRKVPEETRRRWNENLLELWGYCLKEQSVNLDTNRLKTLYLPTLLLKGELSPPRFRMIVNDLGRMMPDAEVFELPRASHGLQGHNPERFNEVVLGFIHDVKESQ